MAPFAKIALTLLAGLVVFAVGFAVGGRVGEFVGMTAVGLTCAAITSPLVHGRTKPTRRDDRLDRIFETARLSLPEPRSGFRPPLVQENEECGIWWGVRRAIVTERAMRVFDDDELAWWIVRDYDPGASRGIRIATGVGSLVGTVALLSFLGLVPLAVAIAIPLSLLAVAVWWVRAADRKVVEAVAGKDRAAPGGPDVAARALRKYFAENAGRYVSQPPLDRRIANLSLLDGQS